MKSETTPAPPESKARRSYNFSIVTYASQEQIIDVLSRHSVKECAYIYHDSDVDSNGNFKEIHAHLVLCLNEATSATAVSKWFARLYDESFLPINTMVEYANKVDKCMRYLCHLDDCDKFQYSLDSVFHFASRSIFDKAVSVLSTECDSCVLALQDMLCGVPLSDIARKYGRDFIYHYGHIKHLYDDIIVQVTEEEEEYQKRYLEEVNNNEE